MDRNFLLRVVLSLLLCIKPNGRRFADYIAATDARIGWLRSLHLCEVVARGAHSGAAIAAIFDALHKTQWPQIRRLYCCHECTNCCPNAFVRDLFVNFFFTLLLCFCVKQTPVPSFVGMTTPWYDFVRDWLNFSLLLCFFV